MSRIAGEQRIRSGQTYSEEEGVTLTATRGANGAANTRGAEAVRSGAGRGVARDEFVGLDGSRSVASTAPPVASRHQEIARRAHALRERAQGEVAGRPREIPAQRTETFQQLVSRQHEHAARSGAVDLAVTLVSAGLGGGLHHAAEHAVQPAVARAALAGAFAAESVPTAVAHRLQGHGLAASVGTGVAHGIAGVALGAAGGGVMTMVATVQHQFADANERIQFQQRATAADAERASALRAAREHRGAGEVDARFAAADRGEINWEIFRSNGDYAAGVLGALRQAEESPSSVAHLTLERPVPTRTSLP
jgi:hypothetical protein